MKTLDNGYLEADRTKSPPAIPEGFEPAFGDPYIFLPALHPCEDREKRLVTKGCCGVTEKLYCDIANEFVTRKKCKECVKTMTDRRQLCH